jgi:hypothetical protein
MMVMDLTLPSTVMVTRSPECLVLVRVSMVRIWWPLSADLQRASKDTRSSHGIPPPPVLIPCGTCWEKVFPGITNRPAAHSSAPSSAGILRSRVADCFRQFIELPLIEVFVFTEQTFPFPRLVNSATAGLNKGKKLSGEAVSLPDPDL